MAQKYNKLEMWKKRLLAELTRDKKKASIMLVLFVLAVFFVGKLLFESAPESASAMSGSVVPTSVQSPGDVASFPKIPKSPRKKFAKTTGDGVVRDIFLPNSKVFPIIAKSEKGDGNKPGVLNKTAEDKHSLALKKKQARIQLEGSKLHLKSTITGRQPIAIINDDVLGCGGMVNGFRVIKIGSQVCVVEKEGVQLDLTME